MSRMRKARRSACPVGCALDVFGDRWTLLVVRDLASGKRYFSELLRSPERIATNILADRLGRLVALGLVERFTPRDHADREGYRLSARGKSLRPVLKAIARWGLANAEGTRIGVKPSFNSEPAR